MMSRYRSFRQEREFAEAIEAGWKNDEEAHRLLDLINSEFRSDPVSTQCFDHRIVERVRLCVASRKEFTAKSIFL